MSEGEAMRLLGQRRAEQDRAAGETPEPTAAPSTTAAEQAACVRISNAAPLGSAILDAAVVRDLRAARVPLEQRIAELLAVVAELEAQREDTGRRIATMQREHENGRRADKRAAEGELARVRLEALQTAHDVRMEHDAELARMRAEQSAAVAREREACAKTIEDGDTLHVGVKVRLAAAIRARGVEPAPTDEQRREADRMAALGEDFPGTTGALAQRLAARRGEPATTNALSAHLFALGHVDEAREIAGLSTPTNPPRRPLPSGWGWSSILSTSTGLCFNGGDSVARANDDGRYWFHDRGPHGQIVRRVGENTAKPEPGETPLAAARHAVEDECRKRGLFVEVGS